MHNTDPDEVFHYLNVRLLKDGSRTRVDWLNRMRGAYYRQHGNLSPRQIEMIEGLAGGIIDGADLRRALFGSGERQ